MAKKKAKRKISRKFRVHWDDEMKCFVGLRKHDFTRWRRAFPRVDLDIEIKKAERYCVAKRRRPRSGTRFLCHWFNRATRDGTGVSPKVRDIEF